MPGKHNKHPVSDTQSSTACAAQLWVAPCTWTKCRAASTSSFLALMPPKNAACVETDKSRQRTNAFNQRLPARHQLWLLRKLKCCYATVADMLDAAVKVVAS